MQARGKRLQNRPDLRLVQRRLGHIARAEPVEQVAIAHLVRVQRDAAIGNCLQARRANLRGQVSRRRERVEKQVHPNGLPPFGVGAARG